MEKTTTPYKRHIFVCTNQRAEGARVCCGEAKGIELVAAIKKAIKDKCLSAEVRAQRAGCFDICEAGPNVVVYPDSVFYGKVSVNDVDELVESHLVNNQPLERLKLAFPLEK
jgi:(2Fe-2S) ferredoxin